jgi:aspartate racemase
VAFGVDVLVPKTAERQVVHDIIYDELCQGEVKPSSKQQYLGIIRQLEARGAQGIILGCTEIGLLIKQADISLPVFDTTRIHAEAAVTLALQK